MPLVATCKHCDQGIYCLRLCFDHYKEHIAKRFWSQVRDTSDPEACWIWEGKLKQPAGYGSFSFGGPKPERGAHRTAYRLLVGEIDPGLHLDHLCMEKRCVNPAHLEPVAMMENFRRAWVSMPEPERPRQITRYPKPKRVQGSGSIRERAPNRWQLRIAASKDPVSGRARTVTETFHGGKRAAQQRLAQLVAQHSGGTTATTATLGTLIERWLDTARLEESTKGNYRNALRHLPATMYSAPLNQVGAHELDALYSALSRGGLGAPTVRVLHAALSSALAQGVKWRWIPMNPARHATPPAPSRPRITPPDTESLSRLLNESRDDPLTYLWLRLAIVTGARRSEVLALRWGDIDGARLTIAGALDIHRARKTTKTGDERTLSLDKQSILAIDIWRRLAAERALAVGIKLTDKSYLISDEPDSSLPWRPDLASKRFRRLCYAAGLPETTRLHDVRHAAASRLLTQGVDLAEVSRRLGHSRASTTTDIYAHSMPGSDEQAGDVAARGIDAG